jgi:membrane-bound ClpP family serine protease
VAELQKNTDERMESILNVIHNNILAIFLLFLSIGLMIFASSLKGIVFLIISTISAFLFIFSLKIVDKGIDEVFLARLAFKRRKASKEFYERNGENVTTEQLRGFIEEWDKKNIGPLQ